MNEPLTAERAALLRAFHDIPPMEGSDGHRWVRRDSVSALIQGLPDPAIDQVTSAQVRAWLQDPEYDRLYWAIAELRGREGGSTTEDEQDARRLLDILDPLT
jgi:hypothetical protein